MPKPSRSQKGYTLIEIAISLFVISAVILIYAAASHAVALNRDAKYRQAANRIAASLMEDLRDTPFASLPVSGSWFDPSLALLPGGSGNLIMTDVNANLKQATVEISWRSPGSMEPHKVILTTLIAKYGF